MTGYKDPPKDRQFQKGRSGNPRGRPRKPKAPPELKASLTSDEILLREAARMIPIGETGEEMTAFEVVLRATYSKAAKGDPRAQKLILERTDRAQLRFLEMRGQLIAKMSSHKVEWTQELQRRKRLRIKGPAPFPHPDNIKIDVDRGLVGIRGGLDEDRYNALEELRRRKRGFPELVARLKREIAEDPEDTELVQLLDDMKVEEQQAIFDRVPDEEPWVYY